MTKSIYKPRPISGFPEWLPEVRRVELLWLDTIRRVFESFGYASIETPAVEEIDVLLAKGGTDKEIYTLTRLQADDSDAATSRLALHFDLTVPFARYVAQNFNDLTFPFKRYQLQKSWRGERPQEGRFREFYQCDIDVIAVDNLPLHFDAEMPQVIYALLHELQLDGIRLHVSNRKILDGFLRGLNVTDPVTATRILDKMDKIGTDGVRAQLAALGLASDVIQKCLAFGTIQTADDGFVAAVSALGIDHPILAEGLTELAFVMQGLQNFPAGSVIADLSIVRGFDYYTGTVYEGRVLAYPELGSVIGGGRYEDLAGDYINKKLPGVGISFGLTRLFSKLLKEGKITLGAKTPTQILIALHSDDHRAAAYAIAHHLRARGMNVETYHAPQKIGKQIDYADKKGIRYVWFPPTDTNPSHSVKDLVAGTQYDVTVDGFTLSAP